MTVADTLLIAGLLAGGAATLGLGMAMLALALSQRAGQQPQQPDRVQVVERSFERITTPNAAALRDGGVSADYFKEDEWQQPAARQLEQRW